MAGFDPGRLRASLSRRLAGGGTWRQMAGTAAAGLILGLGLVTVGTSLGHAAERDGLTSFFEALFGVPRRAEVAPPPQPRRYANLPDPRRHRFRPAMQTPRPRVELIRGREQAARPVRRPRPVAAAVAAPVAASGGTGDRTVCVRLCDGYLFPLGKLHSRADLPLHQAACAAACPNAATSVYTLARGESELDGAVDPQGLPYRASALAGLYRQRRVENCACQPTDGAVHLPVTEDQTLRPGDVVATGDSAGVVTRQASGAVALVDYRSARLTRGRKRQIEAKVGTMRRDEEARTFRQLMRAEGSAPVVHVARIGTGFRMPERAAAGTGVVRVVTASPFER